MQNSRFPSKIALRLKKVCYKVALCENSQRQSCKGIHLPTYPCENDWWGGGDPFYLKLWIKQTSLERNRRFSISFRA